MSLPYEAPSHPGIPSMEEIERSMTDHNRFRNSGAFQVCRVGACVVKRGRRHAVLQEAEDVLFLQAKSTVRTPKVYAGFTEIVQSYPLHHMVTEFSEGETLTTDRGKGLDETSRLKICIKLSEQLHLL